jgi:lipopolysaccharide transport system permease protein
VSSCGSENEVAANSAPASEEARDEYTILPADGGLSFGLSELNGYAELLFQFTLRDILVRYKQTILGVGWAFLQPLMTVVVFTLVFAVFAKVPSGDLPYPVFAMAAVVPWNYFTQAFGRCAVCLVNNAALVSKVYFPRLVIPISVVLAPLLDFVISFLMLLGMMVIYKIWPTWRLLALPAFVGLALIWSLAIGLALAALNARYRDVGHVVPFLTQLATYVSPVGFPSSLVPRPWRLLYFANPMAGVIDGFRWAVLAEPLVEPLGLILGAAVAIAFLLVGLLYFRKTEEILADII